MSNFIIQIQELKKHKNKIISRNKIYNINNNQKTIIQEIQIIQNQSCQEINIFKKYTPR